MTNELLADFHHERLWLLPAGQMSGIDAVVYLCKQMTGAVMEKYGKIRVENPAFCGTSGYTKVG
ncbi:MAG TPA: hypothetical protein VFK88_00070 [Gallionella sp.]|nr:hypothetical protein [Gallionella sp.]